MWRLQNYNMQLFCAYDLFYPTKLCFVLLERLQLTQITVWVSLFENFKNSFVVITKMLHEIFFLTFFQRVRKRLKMSQQINKYLFYLKIWKFLIRLWWLQKCCMQYFLLYFLNKAKHDWNISENQKEFIYLKISKFEIRLWWLQKYCMQYLLLNFLNKARKQLKIFQQIKNNLIYFKILN